VDVGFKKDGKLKKIWQGDYDEKLGCTVKCADAVKPPPPLLEKGGELIQDLYFVSSFIRAPKPCLRQVRPMAKGYSAGKNYEEKFGVLLQILWCA